MRWLAARAADAPDNFLHLLRLLEAERAWAVGDFRAAVLAFDAARREVAGRQRPWHRALITERAARFYLAHGLDTPATTCSPRPASDYWRLGRHREGRPAGLGRLRPLEATPATPADRRCTAGTIDLLGILSASQALSSETSIDGCTPASSRCSAR